MFELLKKKLSSFAEKFKAKVEEKETVSEEKEEQLAKRGKRETISEEIVEAKEQPREVKARVAERETISEEIIKEGKERPAKAVERETISVTKEERVAKAGKIEIVPAAKEEQPRGLKVKVKEREAVPTAIEEQPRELKAKVSAIKKIKRALGKEIEIREGDLSALLWELELSLLEADVEQTTAEEICREIKEKIVGKKIKQKEDIDAVLKREIKNILAAMMETKEIDLLKDIKNKKQKPYKILFLGPNGAGKTTSIAKLSHLLQSRGLKVMWSASDTFRAASIEQLEKHADKLGIRVVKHQYGADPAAVAFDAIKAAQSRNIDVVMIDSAGRQETNKNLMQELQKIVRVAQPDLRLYVGEAFTGQALLQQAQEYDKMVGIDAFILTKIDCDAKGGTTISLLYKLKKPVLFVGTGQQYSDLQKFDPEFVLKRVIG